MKKLITLGAAGLVALTLAGCGSETKTNTNSNEKAEKTVKGTTDSTSDNTFKDNTFTMAKEKVSYKITNVKTFPSAGDQNKKTIVLECDITNNGNEPADLAVKANPYTYVHASQKTNNAEKELQPGTIAIDDNGNNPEQAREDTMNSSKVLPHKTVQGMIAFDTVDDSSVTVTFENQIFKNIGSKTYKIQ